MKSKNKTQATNRSVIDLIADLPESQREDTKALVSMMQDISCETPVIWGSKIIGFGVFHYVSPSGREGDWPRISFAPGTGKFSLYLTSDAADLTGKVGDLGKYKIGKGCVYINKLADVNHNALRRMIQIAYDATA